MAPLLIGKFVVQNVEAYAEKGLLNIWREVKRAVTEPAKDTFVTLSKEANPKEFRGFFGPVKRFFAAVRLWWNQSSEAVQQALAKLREPKAAAKKTAASAARPASQYMDEPTLAAFETDFRKLLEDNPAYLNVDHLKSLFKKDGGQFGDEAIETVIKAHRILKNGNVSYPEIRDNGPKVADALETLLKKHGIEITSPKAGEAFNDTIHRNGVLGGTTSIRAMLNKVERVGTDGNPLSYRAPNGTPIHRATVEVPTKLAEDYVEMAAPKLSDAADKTLAQLYLQAKSLPDYNLSRSPIAEVFTGKRQFKQLSEADQKLYQACQDLLAYIKKEPDAFLKEYAEHYRTRGAVDSEVLGVLDYSGNKGNGLVIFGEVSDAAKKKLQEFINRLYSPNQIHQPITNRTEQQKLIYGDLKGLLSLFQDSHLPYKMPNTLKAILEKS